MIDNINAAPDYGDEPPFACSSVAVLDGEAFACGGTPGHAGKHRYLIDWDSQGDIAAVFAAQEPKPAGMLDLYRDALERLADEDTPVLGSGLGGGAQEELHVRASFAAHTLGRDTCACTECHVSLELGDADSPGAEPDDDVCPDCGMRHKFADDEL